MAANREAQGLQIALIVFVMCTIVLGLMTFVFFNQSNEAMIDEKSRCRSDTLYLGKALVCFWTEEMSQRVESAHASSCRLFI